MSFRVRLPPHLQIRLRGGRIASEGRVEVRSGGGEWGAICGDGWSLLEAIVVCKQLSLGETRAVICPYQ
jgi:hypothetical protein